MVRVLKIEFGVECFDQIGLHWLGYSAAIGLEILGLKKFVGMVIQASWWQQLVFFGGIVSLCYRY